MSVPTAPDAIDYANLSYNFPMDGDVNTAYSAFTQNSLFQIGGNLYTVATQTANFPAICTVYKSIDSGNTWTAMDTANAPQETANFPYAGGQFNQGIGISSFGAIIYIAYRNFAAGLATGVRVASFNTATGLWGATTVDVPSTDAGTGTVGPMGLHATAANTFNLVYSIQSGPTITMKSVQYTGGVWGAATSIGTDITNPELTGYFVDQGTSTAHIAYSQGIAFATNPLTPNPVNHLSIAADGTVSTSDTIIADAVQFSASGFNFTYPGMCYGCVFNGKVVFPFIMHLGINDNIPAVAVKSGNVWTITQLGNDLTDSTGSSGAWIYAAVIGGQLTIFWGNHYFGTGQVDQIRSSTSTDGLTFSTPVTRYDLVTDPPTGFTPKANNNALYNISVTALTDGSIGATFQITDDLSGNAIATYVNLGKIPVIPTVPGSQLVFYGVRRSKNGPSDPAKSTYNYYEKVYEIPLSFLIESVYDPAQPLYSSYVRRQTQISDYDFELRRMVKHCVDGNGAILTNPSPFAAVLYDAAFVARSNVPVCAEFLFNDVTNPTTASGPNYWPSPPIAYRVNSNITLDVFTLLDTTVVLPVRVSILFMGVRRIPC